MGIPQNNIPDFRPDLILSDIYNRSKFEFCAFRGLKVDTLGRIKKGKPKVMGYLGK